MYQKLILIFLIIFSAVLFANPGSEIKGKVIDGEIKQPLTGVNIYIKDTQTGTTTDEDGNFNIADIPSGTYQIVFSYIGYQKVTKTDIIVRPGRPTQINAEMFPSALEIDNVVVKAGYFSETENKPLSTVSFSAEEVRRAPGSAGDVSRILSTLPSLSKGNDQQNSLIVRGGSPVENLYLVDGIEVPNINHYPSQGSSEGPIGIINIDFIEDVSFSSGGFSVENGDRLSSVMGIKFREGDMRNFYPQLNVSMAGAGLSLEGPIAEDKVSYLFSANKSYLDLIANAIQLEGAVPNYGDIQGKITWKLGDNDKISFLNIFAKDYIKFTYDKSLEDEENIFGRTKIWSNVAGLSYQHIWNKKGYSVFSVSHSVQNFDEDFNLTRTKGKLMLNKSDEQNISINNMNFIKISDALKLNLGGGLKIGLNKFDIDYGSELNFYGENEEEAFVNKKLNTIKAGIYAELDWMPVNKLVFKTGVRADYFDYNGKVLYSPRISAIYTISPENTISASAGLYYQNMPNNVLVQSDLFKNIKTPEAYHFVLGYSTMISTDTKLTVELYDKEYRKFPIDPEKPQFFLFDEAVSDNVFRYHKSLVDAGKAYSRGVEIVVQKKLAKDIYGLASGSYSISKYKALDNKWRNRIYDNPLRFAVEGGYILDENWEFSARWIYAQGRPYTPFDVAASTNLHSGVIDINRINDDRVPDYHSLNLRADRRFHFGNSSLVVFLDIWNVYSRANVAAYSWNEISNKQTEIKGWTLMPILGMEWEF